MTLETNLLSALGLRRELERFLFVECVSHEITVEWGMIHVVLFVEMRGEESRVDRAVEAIDYFLG